MHWAAELLVEEGRRRGLDSVTEHPVPGGRIDVVWLWRPPSPVPGVADPLPVAGFEIESSWRTRKHIKGDLINLQDLACSFGVIVLLGEGNDVESTRRFASQLVDRPGSRIVVWSEPDLAELAAEDVPEVAARPATPPRVSAGSGRVERSAVDHHGKYRPLWAWLRGQPGPVVSVTFADVERVLGFALPPSSRRHLPHWYGYDNTAVGRAIRDAGWRARRVNLTTETVTFERDTAQPDHESAPFNGTT